MKSSLPEMTIGEIATRFGVATHVLRHWESAGVLTPERTAGGGRRYGPEHLEQVAYILLGKDAGLSLEQLRALLNAPDRATRDELMDRQRQELRKRIEDARRALEMLDHGRACPREDFTTCPNFRRALTSRIPPPPH